MLQSTVQHLQKFRTTGIELTRNRLQVVCTFGLLQHSCLLNAGLEHSRSILVFKQPRLPINLIFGMLDSRVEACVVIVWFTGDLVPSLEVLHLLHFMTLLYDALAQKHVNQGFPARSP